MPSLNLASNVLLGTTQVAKAYLGGTQAWVPPTPYGSLPISAANPTPTVTSSGGAPSIDSTIINMPGDGQPHQGFPALHYFGSGHLIAWYRSGARHGQTVRGTTGHGVILQTESTDYGATWTQVRTIVDSVAMDDDRGPELTILPGGTWLLVYSSWLAPDNNNDPPTGCVLKYITSADQGATWAAPASINVSAAALTAYPGLGDYMQIATTMIVADDGNFTLLCTGRVNHGDVNYSAFVLRSATLSGQWSATLIGNGPAAGRSYDENCGRKLADGTYLSFSRYGSNGIGRYTSTDGITWSAPTVTINTGASGRPEWIELASGKILLGTRASDTTNQLRLSSDKGVTWSAATDLPPVAGRLATYQAHAEVVPGLVACVYSIENSLADGRMYFRYVLDGVLGTPPPTLTLVATATSTSAAASSVVVNKPGGTTAGDLLILEVNQRVTSVTYTAPAGFTSLGSQAGVGKLQLWYKIADGTEGATFTVSSSSALAAWTAACHRIANAEATAPVATFATGSGTTASAPASTIAESGSLVLATIAGGNASQANITPPTGYTEVFDIRAATTSTNPFMEASYKIVAGTGTEPAATTSVPSQSWMAASIVVRPA